METIKISCPQCGAPGKAGMFCEYCGAEIPLPKKDVVEKKVSDDDSKEKEYIILATSDAKEIKDKVIEAFVNTDLVPLDIFEKVKMDEPTLKYYPMFLFSASYQVSWSCTQIIEVWKERVVYKDGKPQKESYPENEYLPASGVVQGDTTFLIGASDGLYQKIEFDYFGSRPLTDELAKDCGIKDRKHIEEHEAWYYSKDYIEREAAEDVGYQLPGSYENLRCSASRQQNGAAKLIFVPYWRVKYEYAGKKHSFMLRGDRSQEYNVVCLWTKGRQSNTKK